MSKAADRPSKMRTEKCDHRVWTRRSLRTPTRVLGEVVRRKPARSVSKENGGSEHTSLLLSIKDGRQTEAEGMWWGLRKGL